VLTSNASALSVLVTQVETARLRLAELRATAVASEGAAAAGAGAGADQLSALTSPGRRTGKTPSKPGPLAAPPPPRKPLKLVDEKVGPPPASQPVPKVAMLKALRCCRGSGMWMQPPTDFFGRPIVESSKAGALSFGASRGA